jgi:hypothetical protein
MLSFVLYVYPNEIYLKEFQQTIVCRAICCCLYHKQRTLRQQEYIRPLWKQRTSSMRTIGTASTISEQSESTL